MQTPRGIVATAHKYCEVVDRVFGARRRDVIMSFVARTIKAVGVGNPALSLEQVET